MSGAGPIGRRAGDGEASAARPGRRLGAVLARLTALAPLSATEIELVRQLCPRCEAFPAGREVSGDGEPIGPARFVVSGWACRQRALPDGRRQIIDFILPGEAFGLGGRGGDPALGAIVCLTPVETAEADVLVQVTRGGLAPGIGAALAALRRQEEARLVEAVVRLGRQSALERTASLLADLRQRLRASGLAGAADEAFPLPLTQPVLADALGLSLMHVSRTLQQLRREGQLQWRKGRAALSPPTSPALAAAHRRGRLRTAAWG